MAKNDNLTDFLTDVADAIRYKKNTTKKINPQDFSEEIKGIFDVVDKGVSANAVTFYDYDGTILYSYTKEEFLKLGTMPPLPTRGGFTYQQWNWTYEDAALHMSKYDLIEIGATCVTSDGKTKIYITIDTHNNMTISLYVAYYDMLIEWGDGTEDTYTSESSWGSQGKKSHTYAELGDYCICITPQSGIVRLGDFANLSGFVKSNHSKLVHKIEMGNNCYFDDGGVSSTNIASINIPMGISVIPMSCFSQCRVLSFIAIPYGCKTLSRRAFSECSALRIISLPNTLEQVGYPGYSGNYGDVFSSCAIRNIYLSAITKTERLFHYCYGLETAYLPNYTEVGERMFEYCNIKRIDIPEGVKTIGRFAFDYCSATYIKFPSTFTNMSATINYTRNLMVADFTACTSVPEFEGFYGSPSDNCKMVVPDSLFDEWLPILISKSINFASWKHIATDVIPSECLSLEITPLEAEVDAKTTEVKLKISAIVNGKKITNGEIVNNAIYKAAAKSEKFEQNTSTEAIIRELSYTLLGVTATATIVQKGVDANA